MSTNNSINLCQVVDYMLDNFSQTFPIGDRIVNNSSLDYYYPVRTDYWDRWYTDFSFPTIYLTTSGTYEKFPVSDYYTDKEGTTYVSIAVSGFSKDEITVDRDGDKLIVSGKRAQEKKDAEKEFKYVRHDISKKSFVEEFKGNDKWNWDAIKVTLIEGILTIAIPLMESAKPKKQNIKIE